MTARRAHLALICLAGVAALASCSSVPAAAMRLVPQAWVCVPSEPQPTEADCSERLRHRLHQVRAGMLAIWRPLEAPHVRVEIEFKLDTSANPFDACIVSAPNEAQAHAALAAVRAYVAPTALFAGELCMADIVLSATFESQREN